MQKTSQRVVRDVKRLDSSDRRIKELRVCRKRGKCLEIGHGSPYIVGTMAVHRLGQGAHRECNQASAGAAATFSFVLPRAPHVGDGGIYNTGSYVTYPFVGTLKN